MKTSANGKRAAGRAAWFCLELPETDYSQALELQYRLVAARREGRLESDTVILLEHPPVYTLGKRGGRENLKVSDEFLQRSGIQVVPIERGGNITYHGPGQQVAYPIIDLRSAKLSVEDYVTGLEEVMIRTARTWDIPAERNQLNRGVWVGSNKLGSIGIALRRGVSFHGLALNVNLDLTPFSWTNPCGLNGVGMTSMQQVSGQPIPMDKLRRVMKGNFEQVFDIVLESIQLEELEKCLKNNEYA